MATVRGILLKGEKVSWQGVLVKGQWFGVLFLR